VRPADEVHQLSSPEGLAPTISSEDRSSICGSNASKRSVRLLHTVQAGHPRPLGPGAFQLETHAGERRPRAVGRPPPHAENNHHAGMLCSSSYSTVNAFFVPSWHPRMTRPRSPSA